MASRAHLCISLVVCAALHAGCADGGGGPGGVRVSSDPEVQVRFETARRSLEEIKHWKQRGKDVFADCKTIQMLFFKELKKSKSKAARALARDIVKTCQDVKPL